MSRLRSVLDFLQRARLYIATRVSEFAEAVVPKLTVRGWFSLALPTSLFLSFIVSVGPATQNSIFSAIGTDAPDIFSAAQQAGLSALSDPLAWLALGFHPVNLLLGAAIALLLLRQESVRGAVIATAIWSAVVLTCADLVGGVALRQMSLAAQISNVVANSIGGIVIAALVGGAFVVFRAVARSVPHRPKLSLVLGAVSIVLLGICVSAGTLFALRYVYQPLPAQFVLVLSPPSDGMWNGAVPPPELALGEPREFDLLPTFPTRGGISLNGADGPFAADWVRERGGQQYDVTVRFVGDCPFNDFDELPLGAPILQRTNVVDLRVDLDGGAHRFEVGPEDQRSFAFRPQSSTYFWLDTEDNDSGARITYFTATEDRTSMTSSGSVSFLASAYMLDRVGERYEPRPRRLTLQINGERWEAILSRPGPVYPNRRLECHVMSAQLVGEDASEINVPTTGAEMHVGIVVTITPALTELASFAGPHESRLTLTGASGWTSITHLSVEELARSSRGRMTVLTAGGNLSGLEVNGLVIPIGPQDRIVARGDFNAAFGEGAQLHVSGEATSLWKNTRRLNPTRAESVPTEISLALLTAVVAAIGFLVRLAWMRLRLVLAYRPEDLPR